MIKKLSLFVFLFVISISMVSSAFASESQTVDPGKEVAKNIQKYSKEFKKYARELEVSVDNPYKEIKLEDGTVIFNSISVSTQSNVMTKADQSTNTMTSSQGAKNAFGFVLYQLDYSTSWTFDYNTVVSSYSWTTVDNGLGWSFKTSNSYGPGIQDNGKTHQWTGTAQFAMIVGGIDISTETLTNIHKVRHDGTYAWKYEVS